MAGILTFFLSGCAGTPITHPNEHEAGEHLSEAQNLLTRNHPNQAIESVKEALKRHRLANDYTATIEDMNRLAHLNSISGRNDIATVWIDKALVLESVSNGPVQKIETLLLAAEIALEKEDPTPWLTEASRQIDLLPQDRQDEKNRLRAKYFQVLGLHDSEKKHYLKALELFKKALVLDRERKNRISTASDLANLGRNQFLLNRNQDALKSFSEAYSIDRKLHNPSGVAFDLEGLSLALAQNGHYQKSAKKMLEASGIQMGLGRLDAAKKDISYVRSILVHLKGPSRKAEVEILSHWFDSE